MHAELIRGFAEPYGPGCWNIICTVGVRVKREPCGSHADRTSGHSGKRPDPRPPCRPSSD
eukprot:5023519-Alexandrium_andersonii.AAC.1